MSKPWAVIPHDNYMTESDDAPIQIIDGDGNTVACNTTYYPTAITAEHAATIVAAVNRVAELETALKFYLDSWACTTNSRYGGLEWKPAEALLDDCGNIARAALSQEAAGVPAVAGEGM